MQDVANAFLGNILARGTRKLAAYQAAALGSREDVIAFEPPSFGFPSASLISGSLLTEQLHSHSHTHCIPIPTTAPRV